MPEPQVYKLRTLNDILIKVPSDRIPECLGEILPVFVAIKRVLEQAKINALDFDLPEEHTWVDDGRGVTGFTITSKKTGETHAKVTISPEFQVDVESQSQEE